MADPLFGDTSTATVDAKVYVEKNIKQRGIIRCGNCDYIGPGEPGRRIVSKVLAWICVFFAPLVTIIYFVVTNKYRCPRCHSAFLRIQNKDGSYSAQNRGSRHPLMIFLYVLIGIAFIGILSSIVLASLNTARQKGADALAQNADWQTYNSVADQFSVEVPVYPTISSSDDTTDDSNPYIYNSYISHKGDSTFSIFDYKYTNLIDVSDPNVLLENLLNHLNTALAGQLVSSTFTTYASYPALDFEIDAKSEFVKGRMILVGQVPYILGYDYLSLKYSDVDYRHFIDSFLIK